MLTVDEASAYTGLAVAVVVPFLALAETRIFRSSSRPAAAGFFGRSTIIAIGAGLASMAVSIPLFHLLVGDRYNHMALGVWSIAFISIFIVAPASSGLATALFKRILRQP